MQSWYDFDGFLLTLSLCSVRPIKFVMPAPLWGFHCQNKNTIISSWPKKCLETKTMLQSFDMQGSFLCNIVIPELKTFNTFKIYLRRNFDSVCNCKNPTIILSWPEWCSVTIKTVAFIWHHWSLVTLFHDGSITTEDYVLYKYMLVRHSLSLDTITQPYFFLGLKDV